MSTRAPSATSSNSPAAAPADGGQAVLDAALDAAIALSRMTTRDRAAQEAAQLLQRLAGAHAVAIGVVDADAPHAIAVAAHLGFPGDAEARARLEAAWEPLVAASRPVMSESADGREFLIPLGTGDAVVGLMLVRTDHPDARDAALTEPLLAAVARPLSIALERATDVHRAEQRIRLDAIGDVAAGLAHELRNPLFGISSAAQLLRYRVTEDPVIEKNVGRILREVERLNTMVTALLEYGRPSPMRLEPGDPDGVWDEVLRQQRGRLESRALRVQRERAPRPCTCLIDRAQLAQALVNLLDNAIDAAPEGTDLLLVTDVLPTGAWRSSLTNGGSVVPPDVRQRAFELFFSTKPAGTGVGLPLCRRIVEEHGGTVRLDSDAASGTVATVVLPAEEG